jgi:hypothetical protein
MADNYERLVRWYLRFNGYFTIENFILHNSAQVSAGSIGPYTEADILAVRMPYSSESIWRLQVANHKALTTGAEGLHDVVIAEVKSKRDNQPNDVWKVNQDSGLERFVPIEYIVRFVGLHQQAQVRDVARQLALSYRYEDSTCRFRYVVFSKQPNKHFQTKGATYITFDEVIRFLADVRGQSWAESGLGVASIHHQWDPLINEVFAVVNDFTIPLEERQKMVLNVLARHDPAPVKAS